MFLSHVWCVYGGSRDHENKEKSEICKMCPFKKSHDFMQVTLVTEPEIYCLNVGFSI